MTSGLAKRRVTGRFAGTTMHCGWKENCVATSRLVTWPAASTLVSFRELARQMQRLRIDGFDVARGIDVMDETRIDDRQHDDADDAARNRGPAELGPEDGLFGRRHGSAHHAAGQEHERVD